MTPIRLAIWLNRNSLNLTGIMFLPILAGIILAIEFYCL